MPGQSVNPIKLAAAVLGLLVSFLLYAVNVAKPGAEFVFFVLICLAALLLEVVRVGRRQGRWRRWPAWRCQHCGYDLRGNVSGVCPECGKPSTSGRD